MWKNAKIYNDGSHYIAIPHKPNQSYRPRKILRICEILKCNVGDVMDATKKED